MFPSHLSNVDLQGQDGPPELDALSDPVRENCSVVSMGAESHRLCLVPAPGPPSRDVMHWGAPLPGPCGAPRPESSPKVYILQGICSATEHPSPGLDPSSLSSNAHPTATCRTSARTETPPVLLTSLQASITGRPGWAGGGGGESRRQSECEQCVASVRQQTVWTGWGRGAVTAHQKESRQTSCRGASSSTRRIE